MNSQPLEIVICMGSSCYSRGNGRTIEAIQGFVAQENVQANLVGHLCEGECNAGPNIAIGGTHYKQVDAATVLSILTACGKS